MIWENSIETCILSYMKYIASPGSMHETECSGVGWGGRWERGSGWGTHVHPWLIHVNVWQKPPQYCKVISLQLKKKRMCIQVKLNHFAIQQRLAQHCKSTILQLRVNKIKNTAVCFLGILWVLLVSTCYLGQIFKLQVLTMGTLLLWRLYSCLHSTDTHFNHLRVLVWSLWVIQQCL